MTHEIHYVATALIFILMYVRYQTKNGWYAVFAGLFSLYLTIEYVNHDLFLGIAFAFTTFYLIYDGLMK